MRIVESWEGTDSQMLAVDLEEGPWTLLWAVQDTTALEGTFTISIRSEGSSVVEQIDIGAGANHTIKDGIGRYEIAIQSRDVKWSVWVLLQTQA